MTRSSILLAIAIGLTGCGTAGVKHAPVSGTVNLDGAPLAEGMIYFKTVATGAIEALPIKDGKFSGNAEPGERRVEITAYRSTPRPNDPMKGEIQHSLIGSSYNTESKLTAKVNSDGPNTFTFDVKAK